MGSPAGGGPSFPAVGTSAAPTVGNRLLDERISRRQKSASLSLIVVPLVVLLTVGGFAFGAWYFIGQQDSALNPNDQAVWEQARALVIEQQHLTNQTKFSTKYNVRSLGENCWEVSSSMQSPGRFDGYMLQQPWTAEVKQLGANVWQIDRLEIDGELVAARRGKKLASASSSNSAPREQRRDPYAGINYNSDDDDPPATSADSGSGSEEEHDLTWGIRHLASDISTTSKEGKTLVVWLVDRSASNESWRSALSLNFEIFGKLLKSRPGTPDPNLEMALCTYGGQVEFPVEKPTRDGAEIQSALDNLEVETSGMELTFEAIRKAIEKFGNYNENEAEHYLMLVVVSDEAGNDQDQADQALAQLNRYGATLHVLGVNSPFGREYWEDRKAEEFAGDRSLMQNGPESLYPQRINLMFWDRNFSNDTETLPSGFGPFTLSRLCRATGGTYFACTAHHVRSTIPTRYEFLMMNGAPMSQISRDFDPEVMARYAPEYISPEQYETKLASNKAIRALHDAAKLPRIEFSTNLSNTFETGDEAALKRQLDEAQKGSAKLEPQLRAVYDILAQGERDRPKLQEPRWQAGYDLAMGRILAARVRAEGYNAMLAKLKQGMKFQNETSTVWTLEPSDSISVGSTFENMLADSKKYLDNVIKQHPGTPWAYLAKREQESMAGWEWKER